LHGAAFSDLILHRMLKEMSAISAQLDPGVGADWMLKRVQFMAYELRSHTPLEATAFELCETLNDYFFKQKGFKSIPKISEAKDPLACLLLQRVLSSRVGSPAVLSLIYSFLATQIGLKLEFVDLRPTCFLKFVENGNSHYVDMNGEGRVLTSEALLESLHLRIQMKAIPKEALLEPVSVERFLCEYLGSLKSEYIRRSNLESLLIIQNALLAQQPSSLQLLAERALLYRRLGHFKQALSDLKRYFSFHDKETAPSEVLTVFHELTELVERQKTTIQLLD
jgi:regulator of sirC expression with transglutaminase-like and TPR domain